MGWQDAWQLYQDEHPDADWYDFEEDYWGDESEENENTEESDNESSDFVRQTVWNDELKCYQAIPYTPIANKGFDYIQKYGKEEDAEEVEYYADLERERERK